MARMTFKAGEAYALKLAKFGAESKRIGTAALYAAANIVANKIKSNLESLPEEPFRYLREGDTFNGVPEMQQQDLVSSFGISRIDEDENGNLNVKLGFDGYGRFPTYKYPQGLPNQLLARSIESGSSVRKKHPFVRPAVNATKKLAIGEMEKIIDEEIGKIFNGGK